MLRKPARLEVPVNQPVVFCTHCGWQNPAANSFCDRCGAALPVAQLPAYPQQSPPPPAYPQQTPPPPPYGGYPPPASRKANALPWIILAVVVVAAAAAIIFLLTRGNPPANPQSTLAAGVTPPVNATPTLRLSTPKTSTGGAMYDAVTLTEADLPPGFDIISDEEAAEMGLDMEAFGSTLSGFTTTDPVKSITALKFTSSEFEMAFVLIAAPISPFEMTNFDKEVSNPAQAVENFAEGLGGPAEYWAAGSTVGEASIGMFFSIDSGDGMVLLGDVIVFRRGDALAMVLTFYLEGGAHEVDTRLLAQKVDIQIQNIQR